MTFGIGCKHGKVNQKNAMIYIKSIIVLVKGPKTIEKCFLHWIFFMMTSIHLLNTQM